MRDIEFRSLNGTQMRVEARCKVDTGCEAFLIVSMRWVREQHSRVFQILLTRSCRVSADIQSSLKVYCATWSSICVVRMKHINGMCWSLLV